MDLETVETTDSSLPVFKDDSTITYVGQTIAAPLWLQRRLMPVAIKKQVWERYAPGKLNTRCFCCTKSTHRSHPYVAHLETNTSFTINNLRPICQSCDLAIAKRSIREFQVDNKIKVKPAKK